MRIFPVPMRVEKAEKQKLEFALDAARDRFDPLLAHHLPEKQRDIYWGRVQVFYEPYYAYEEVLATFRDKPLQAGSVLSSLESLTDYLSEGMVKQLVPVSDDDRANVLAQYSRRPKPSIKADKATQYEYIFYLSYAHSDGDQYVQKLFKDLSDEVRRLSATGLGSVGFADFSSIGVGDAWRPQILKALGTSRLAVCLYSPAYFASEYCGKEFQLFRWRMDLNRTISGGSGDNPILPVLWVTPNGPLPEGMPEIQIVDSSTSSAYIKEGLRFLMRLAKFRDEYQEFVVALARKVVQAAERSPLPALASLPPIETVGNAFEIRGGKAVARKGPDVAKFIFAAASSSELAAVKQDRRCYGFQGGADWRPFFPSAETSVAILAQEAATRAKFFYQELPIGFDLFERLGETVASNQLVIVVVDPWALKVDSYRAALEALDRVYQPNLAVLVVWNDQDVETKQEEATLDEEMRLTFERSVIDERRFFRNEIRTPKQFTETVVTALNRLRTSILASTKVFRTAEGGSRIKAPSLKGPVEGGRSS